MTAREASPRTDVAVATSMLDVPVAALQDEPAQRQHVRALIGTGPRASFFGFRGTTEWSVMVQKPAGEQGTVLLTGEPLSIEQVGAVARRNAPVAVADEVRARLTQGRRAIEAHLASSRPVYGVTTGFGALADVSIDRADIRRLQENLVRSHAAAVGDPLPVEVVRAMMLLRARTLAAGYSGVRPELLDLLVALINEGLHPVVPDRGSVGASGDLAQLAHIGLCLMGEGRVHGAEGPEPTADALARAGLRPVVLEAKEGLALVNGTEGMAAFGALGCLDVRALVRAADVTAAMTVESGHGTDGPFAEELHAIRPHPGQRDSAANLRRLLADSPVIDSHRHSDHAVQDPYSVRCSPQVHGAARETLAFAERIVGTELGSVTDNPVLLPDGRVESTGNFHGEPLAYALDLLAIGVAGIANVAERRTLWLIGHSPTRGLPPFLSNQPGLGSGYMLAQYTQAALVSECKLLGTPAGLDSIPTSGTQEDHVSMGWLSGLKLWRSLPLARQVVAIEAVCAAQAVDLRAPHRPAAGTGAAHARVRAIVPHLDEDRELAPELEAAERLIRTGDLVAAVEEEIGALA
jgi:histidine ammonia-lyase